jgi:hypothetical protein
MIREAFGGALLEGSSLSDIDHVVDGPAPTRAFKPPKSWPSLLEPSPQPAAAE